MRPHIIFFSLVVLSASCVTQKKYNELLAEKVKLDGELTISEDSVTSLNSYNEQLKADLEGLLEEARSLEDSLRTNRQQQADLQGEYDRLETVYNNLLNNSSRLNRDLSAQQRELEEMRANLQSSQEINDALAADLKEREAKVSELESVLARKDEAVNALKSRISNALLSFKDSELTVDVKNGKVYVSLAEQLLFGSGSIAVDPKGQSALKQLASALKGQEDLNIMVEGHTDNVPISRTSQYMKDNWDLSVMRATSIVKILVDNGVSANQVTAAGKGEFYPVDSNETAEGRAKNRRTEIIITPDLDELFRILETN